VFSLRITPMMKNWPLYGPTATLILLSLCGCAAAPTCRKPLHDLQAPPPQMFSRCLREILQYGQNRVPISQACSSFLQAARIQ